MSMFNIILILALALIVFGPDDLPRIARTMGRIFNQGRNLLQGVSKDFTNMVNEPVKDIKNVMGDINAQTKDVAQRASQSLDIDKVSEKVSEEEKPAQAAAPSDTLLRYEDLSQGSEGSSQETVRAANPLETLPQDLVRDKRT